MARYGCGSLTSAVSRSIDGGIAVELYSDAIDERSFIDEFIALKKSME